MITDAWLNLMRDVLYGDTVNMPSHIALGTGTSAAAAGDTALETESIRGEIDHRTKPADKRVRYQGTLSADQGNGVSFTENGALNAAVAGTLMNRQTHTAIAKSSAYELRIQIDTELSDQ